MSTLSRQRKQIKLTSILRPSVREGFSIRQLSLHIREISSLVSLKLLVVQDVLRMILNNLTRFNTKEKLLANKSLLLLFSLKKLISIDVTNLKRLRVRLLTVRNSSKRVLSRRNVTVKATRKVKEAGITNIDSTIILNISMKMRSTIRVKLLGNNSTLQCLKASKKRTSILTGGRTLGPSKEETSRGAAEGINSLALSINILCVALFLATRCNLASHGHVCHVLAIVILVINVPNRKNLYTKI